MVTSQLWQGVVTDTGEVLNHNPQWVKVIHRHGAVVHIDWTTFYEQVRRASGHSYPGFVALGGRRAGGGVTSARTNR